METWCCEGGHAAHIDDGQVEQQTSVRFSWVWSSCSDGTHIETTSVIQRPPYRPPIRSTSDSNRNHVGLTSDSHRIRIEIMLDSRRIHIILTSDSHRTLISCAASPCLRCAGPSAQRCAGSAISGAQNRLVNGAQDRLVNGAQALGRPSTYFFLN